MSRLPTKSTGPIRVRSLRERNRASNDTEPAAEWTLQPQVQPEPGPQRTALLKLLRFPAIRERTGLSRSTIWRLEQRGDFPKHRRISANAVAWVEEEILIWIHSKIDDVAV